MPRIKSIPNREMYDNYFMKKGRYHPGVFHGSIIQQGYGINGLLSSIMRSVTPLLKKTFINHGVPLIKKGVTEIGKQGINQLSNILKSKIKNKKITIKQINNKKRKTNSSNTTMNNKRKKTNKKKNKSNDIFE